MDPIDFHKTAEFLQGQKDEWHVRTSINRSYYGLFLYFREFLTRKGVQLPNRSDKSHHQFILECLHECSLRPRDNILYNFYSNLKTLLQWRTSADYSLHVKINHSTSEDMLKLAKETISGFGGLNDPQKEQYIIDVAKAHALTIPSRYRR